MTEHIQGIQAPSASSGNAADTHQAHTDKRGISEDIVALIVGLVFFALALPTIAGVDLLGWTVTTSVWIDPTKALAPVAKSYASLGGDGALLATIGALLVFAAAAAALLKLDAQRFILKFLVVFALSYLSWVLGSHAHIATITPADLAKFGVSWSLHLTNESGFILALIAGLVIANVFPRFAAWLSDAIRPELYIKIAIVILGGFIAVTAAEKLSLASTVLLRGIAAIVEAYLIYWAVVYFIARKWFGFNREWAVPLASGVSICGVAAAIATGGAIRAKPIVPILVSSLVVVFAVVEVLVLPFVAQHWLSNEPLVAAAWLGLAVKTDGAAVASGNIAESLILAKNAAQGINYQAGWILGTTAAVKVFIDIFIGVWSFILAYIWTNHIDKREGDRAKAGEIWQRFPKFIIGFIVTFAIALVLVLAAPELTPKVKAAAGEANVFRVLFFLLAFFSIGVQSNFNRLWKEAGIGKLVAVYVVSLFGFVIWVGLLISWIFFAGVKPPLVG
ncbi:MAG TPA: putative sulfate exporter family transporter [Rhodocyclaceae bacterium]|nr:putative sulfate exporter family transporter [Rhodocyclaceae bacterium]